MLGRAAGAAVALAIVVEDRHRCPQESLPSCPAGTCGAPMSPDARHLAITDAGAALTKAGPASRILFAWAPTSRAPKRVG